MLIIGLMVIALICLAVGLALPSSAWLIASLIATAGAGYLVWKMRSAIAPVAAGPGAASITESDDVAGQQPERSARDDDDDETTVIAAVPAEDTQDDVADSHADAPAAPEPARAAADVGETQVIAAVPAAEAGDVWVIDGRPRYHLGNCPIIQGQDAEPIPFDQAVEDGFMPCSLCEPNMARTTR